MRATCCPCTSTPPGSTSSAAEAPRRRGLGALGCPRTAVPRPVEAPRTAKAPRPAEAPRIAETRSPCQGPACFADVSRLSEASRAAVQAPYGRKSWPRSFVPGFMAIFMRLGEGCIRAGAGLAVDIVLRSGDGAVIRLRMFPVPWSLRHETTCG